MQRFILGNEIIVDEDFTLITFLLWMLHSPLIQFLDHQLDETLFVYFFFYVYGSLR